MPGSPFVWRNRRKTTIAAATLGTSLDVLLRPGDLSGPDDPQLVDVGLPPDMSLSDEELSQLAVGVKVKRQPPFQRSSLLIFWKKNEATRVETTVMVVEAEGDKARSQEED